MDVISGLLLFTSAFLASVKNILVKSFSGYTIKKREFFNLQAVVFAAGCTVLFVVNIFDFNGISCITVGCALLYGALLVGAQWFYSLALTQGKTALCATVYSFGFVVPTLSGVMFWDEAISVFGILGIIAVIPALIMSSIKPSSSEKSKSNAYIIPLILAMLCSGGIGIVQKIHQNSNYANQRNSMLLIAFAFALLCSLIMSFSLKKGEKCLNKKCVVSGAFAGTIFSSCNLLNTLLAGWLDSAVFFPAINIGSILFSLVLGLIICKEKLSKKDIIVLCLGTIAIVLVNL